MLSYHSLALGLKKQFVQTAVDSDYRKAGIIVNLDRHVPIDEFGVAYTSSKQVIAAITRVRLAEVEHTLWPLASLKAM